MLNTLLGSKLSRQRFTSAGKQKYKQLNAEKQSHYNQTAKKQIYVPSNIRVYTDIFLNKGTLYGTKQ